jgi:hypothetical protein
MNYDDIKEEELESYIEKLLQCQEDKINKLYDKYYQGT